MIAPANDGSHGSRPIRAQARTKLLGAIVRARRWLDELISGRATNIETIAVREGVSERSARIALSLAFLAPDIVKAAVDATLPRGFGVSRLMDMPPSWAEQRKLLGWPRRAPEAAYPVERLTNIALALGTERGRIHVSIA